MAIHSWPSTDIMDLLEVESATFGLQRQRELSRAGSGTVYRKDLGPAFLMASIQSVPLEHATAEQVMALIESMEDQLSTFYVHNPRMRFPQSDPQGTLLGSATPVIASVNADNKRVTISGLPAGYVLTRGDWFGVDYLSPSRRALYRVVDATVTADGDGLTPLFEVSPNIRTGLTAGDSVLLKKPGCNMMILPGSLQDQTDGPTTSRIQFQAIEQP